MLQAHTDMVCAKEPWSRHDFLRDPIEIREKDGWMMANGTTLGADDGAGVANILGLLDEPALSHPPLECVFTVQEEDGMGGAKGLDMSALRSRRMIGLDGIQEGTTIYSASAVRGCKFQAKFCQDAATGREHIPADSFRLDLRTWGADDWRGAGQCHQGSGPPAAAALKSLRNPAFGDTGRWAHSCDSPGVRGGICRHTGPGGSAGGTIRLDAPNSRGVRGDRPGNGDGPGTRRCRRDGLDHRGGQPEAAGFSLPAACGRPEADSGKV